MYTFFLLVIVPSIFCFDNRSFNDYIHNEFGPQEKNCDLKLEGADWLLAQRRQDYGWGKETHRALIALVIESRDWAHTKDKELMIVQLQQELTKALLRNSTLEKMPIGELALYIHAFLATGLNPRNFFGDDLVAALQHQFLHESTASPFTVLALCNAGALDHLALKRISTYLTDNSKEMKAIAVKAFACAFRDSPDYVHIYGSIFKAAVSFLTRLQKEDGSFGNFYTTSLMIQALVASGNEGWDTFQAMDFMRENHTNKNVMSIYYASMALNSDKVKFIKDLTHQSEKLITDDGFPSVLELQRRPKQIYVQYTLKSSRLPDFYYTINIHIPLNVTFFDVMRLAAAENDLNYRFNYSLNVVGQPEIYSISGIPNDAENALYWKLSSHGQMKRSQQQQQSSNPNLYFHNEGVNQMTPSHGSHWIYVYEHI